eukprot:SRR837773.14130.p1 GENE.SRR837773.14130~~SRR837773.14130.p1  ORF type:complete len:565 (-),score=107.20 SRR837773.14130:4-1698(-)
MKLRVCAADGKSYCAEVLQVSKAKSREQAPVKVRYLGYTADDDEWVGFSQVQSKALKAAGARATAVTSGTPASIPKQEKSGPVDKADISKPSRQKVDEIVSAGWIIPVDTEKVLKDHAVIIQDGKIFDILPAATAEIKYSTRKKTHLPNAALMPGFVNAHTHSTMVYLRGVSDDIALREWLEKTIWPLEFKLCSEQFVRDGAELAILEMISGGTTTFNDMYWYPEAVCKAVDKSGIRAAVGMIAIEFPFGNYGSGPDEYLAKGEKLAEAHKDHTTVSFTVSLHAPYTCSDDTIRKGKTLSDKLQVPLHIHLHETSEEVEASIAGKRESPSCHMSDSKCSPVENLKRLGVLNDRLIAVHMNWLTDQEVKWCSENKVNVVHCPASNLKLASGFCRVADLLAAGVNVAIGTDGASSNNTLDMMAEMKLAAILGKGVAKDAAAVPALTAIRMATLNGAKALGLDRKIGSLTVGKEADMIAVDFSSPSAWPAPTSATPEAGFDPVTHIVYSSTRDHVTDVWVRGRRLMRERKVCTLKQAEVQKAAAKWGDSITKVIAELRAAEPQVSPP